MLIFSEKVVVRLLFYRTAVFWNGLVPFFRIVEFRINIENHPAKRMLFVPNDLA